ncbi:MAG TPA: tetratricopeptide repeat protein [Pyrinomonadaceae bacterium]
MTKDNVLFAIIGVLLGVIVGYVFATNINRQAMVRNTAAERADVESAQDSELPANHPPIPPNASAGQGAGSSGDAALIEAARSEPDNFEAQMRAATAQYRQGRLDEAIQFLTRANQLRPESYQVIAALGDTNLEAGRYETAEKWYTAALAKEPKDVNVRTGLGISFLFRQPPDLDRAIKELRRSLDLDSRHELTLQYMASALTKKGRFDEAEAMLKKLSEVNPSNQDLAKLRGDLEAQRSASKKPAAK